VLELIQIEHEESVAAGGFEEGVIPLERDKPCAARSRLRASKSWRSESFLSSCACALAEKKKKYGGQEKSGISHAGGVQPRTRTALKLRTTWPPAVGRPKLSMGLKREKSSIWSSWRRSSKLLGRRESDNQSYGPGHRR